MKKLKPLVGEHTCEPILFNKQCRCRLCGRFMTASERVLVKKDTYISHFRENVCQVDFVKRGKVECGIFSLKKELLSDYVGKGKSKSAPSDKIFVYDVMEHTFKGMEITNIKNIKKSRRKIL